MGMFCNEPDINCQNDAAVGVLKNIYGDSFISAFLTDGGSPASATPVATDIAPIILGGLATVAGMLAIVVFFSLIITSLISSAQDGEAFGKGSAKSIIVFRFLFSIMLLMPTGSQYCIAQIILMGFVLWSNGETNKIYHNIVSASALSNVGGAQPAVIPPNSDPFNLKRVALAHFSQLYCYNLVNANYFPASHENAKQVAGANVTIATSGLSNRPEYISSIYQHSNTPGIRATQPVKVELDNAGGNSGKSYVWITNLIDRSRTLNAKEAAVCGSLRVYTNTKENNVTSSDFNPNSMGMTLDEQREIFEVIATAGHEIATQKRRLMLYTTGVVTNWVDQKAVNFSFNSGAQSFSDEMAKLDVDDMLREVNSDVIEKSRIELQHIINTFRLDEATNRLVGSLTAKGWTYAGGIKQRIISAQIGLAGNLNLPMVEFTEPQYSLLTVNDEREEMFNLARSIKDAFIAKSTISPQYGEDAVLVKLSSKIPDEFTEDMDIKNLTSDMQDSYSSLISTVKRGIVSYILTGEFTSDPQAALASSSIRATWLDNDRDVLANLQRTGEFLAVTQGVINVGHKAIVFKVLVAKAASAVSPFFPETKYKVATTVLDFIKELLNPLVDKLMVYMDVLILYMAVIIPSMPYFFFITGVVAWYIHTLQAMAGLPFWAIMHMIPERSFVGSQTQGYVTVISLFLRPMLTLTGLFFGFILANPILFFVTDAFFTMQESLMQNNTGHVGGDIWQYVVEFFTFANWLIVYCTLVLQICYMIFGLAGTLPDTVLRWLGSGLSAGGWGESQAQNALSGGVKSATDADDAVKKLNATRNKGKDTPDNSPDDPSGGGGGGNTPAGKPSSGNNLATGHQPGTDDARAAREQSQADNSISPISTSPYTAGSNNLTKGSPVNFTPKANAGNQFLAMGGVTTRDGSPMDNKALFKAGKTSLSAAGGKAATVSTAISIAQSVKGVADGVAQGSTSTASVGHYSKFGGAPSSIVTSVSLGSFSKLPKAK